MMKTAMKIGLLVLLVAAITGCPAVGSAITSPQVKVQYTDASTIELVVEGRAEFFYLENGVEVRLTDVGWGSGTASTTNTTNEVAFGNFVFENVAGAAQATIAETIGNLESKVTIELLDSTNEAVSAADIRAITAITNGADDVTIALAGDPSVEDDGNKPIELYARSAANYDVKIPVLTNKATKVEDAYGPQIVSNTFPESDIVNVVGGDIAGFGISSNLQTDGVTVDLTFDEAIRWIDDDVIDGTNFVIANDTGDDAPKDVLTITNIDTTDYTDDWDLTAAYVIDGSNNFSEAGITVRMDINDEASEDDRKTLSVTVTGAIGMETGDIFDLTMPLFYYLEDDLSNRALDNANDVVQSTRIRMMQGTNAGSVITDAAWDTTPTGGTVVNINAATIDIVFDTAITDIKLTDGKTSATGNLNALASYNKVVEVSDDTYVTSGLSVAQSALAATVTFDLTGASVAVVSNTITVDLPPMFFYTSGSNYIYYDPPAVTHAVP